MTSLKQYLVAALACLALMLTITLHGLYPVGLPAEPEVRGASLDMPILDETHSDSHTLEGAIPYLGTLDIVSSPTVGNSGIVRGNFGASTGASPWTVTFDNFNYGVASVRVDPCPNQSETFSPMGTVKVKYQTPPVLDVHTTFQYSIQLDSTNCIVMGGVPVDFRMTDNGQLGQSETAEKTWLIPAHR